MKNRLSPFLAAAVLIGAATAPAHADPAGCDAKLDALDARIAAARDARADDRVARLRAVRERVRHFCSRRHGQASAVQAPAAGPRGAAADGASPAAGRQPAV
ncbi:DUF1090 family protein [Burkholderia sp. 4701]|nr:DUF1090 family protein [Burkholderia sp. 4701]MXN86788.1 DUF1090 family protein [Burkholderia sp. 4812]